MKQILAGLAVVLVLFSGCGRMPENPTTWSPKFEESSHVRLDPELDAVKAKILTPEFQKSLQLLPAKHNLATYVLLVEEGKHGSDSASRLLSRLLPKWKSARGFPKGGHVVIVWMRSRANPEHGSLAIAVGEHVQQMGVSSAQLDQICQANAGENAEKSVTKLLEALNAQIEHPEQETGTPILVIVVLVILGLILLIGLVGTIVTGDPMMLLWILILFNLGDGGGGGSSMGGGSF